MSDPRPLRWGILGTANIARHQFLPALAEVGGGRAVLVGSRDGGRAAQWAVDEGVERGVEGYEAVVESTEVDAVYVALPNAFHATWVLRALEAGKAVLCEKLLCRDRAEAEPVLSRARAKQSLLWEAFVFPFQAQHRRLLELVAAGTIGEPREVVSTFHFRVTQPANIRLDAELGGGALADVGCYPVRLAQELFGVPWAQSGGASSPPVWCSSRAGGPDGATPVDVDTAAIVDWGGKRLSFSCGFERAVDTYTRILGTTGRLHVTNPYHPGTEDTLTLLGEGSEPVVERPTTDDRSFSGALRHVHGVLRGEEEPRHLAVDDTAATLAVLDALQAAIRSGRS